MEEQQLETALPRGKNSTVCSTALGGTGAGAHLEMVQKHERKEEAAKPQHHPLTPPGCQQLWLPQHCLPEHTLRKVVCPWVQGDREQPSSGPEQCLVRLSCSLLPEETSQPALKLTWSHLALGLCEEGAL